MALLVTVVYDVTSGCHRTNSCWHSILHSRDSV